LSLSLIGEYFLRRPENISPPASLQNQVTEAAAEAWPFIQGTASQAVLEDFIRQFGATIYGSLARARLEELKSRIKEPQSRPAPPAALDRDDAPIEPGPSTKNEVSKAVHNTLDDVSISDPDRLKEVRTRLYELNYDPGPVEGPLRDPARRAIREFETANRLKPTGEPTQGLLQRLRAADSLKPWAAIVYSKRSEKWGMGWGKASRQEAVASARATCEDADQCTIEISFFGTDCGAFAHSSSSWAIVARDNAKAAKDAALADCKKRGKACRIIAAVCATGAERTIANE
jgi:hypothetical protein